MNAIFSRLNGVIVVIFISLFFFAPLVSLADVYVKGYYRKDGTYVAPHYRSDPDGIRSNNWSYPGNTNPYTGETAGGSVSSYLNNYSNSSPSYSPSDSNRTYTVPSYKVPSYKSDNDYEDLRCVLLHGSNAEAGSDGDCKCKSGYTVSSDRSSCVLPQVKGVTISDEETYKKVLQEQITALLETIYVLQEQLKAKGITPVTQ